MREDGIDGGSSGSRWVDGSEVESEAPPRTAAADENEEGCGSIRRRLVKKAKRVDSLDVEAMEISATFDHHSKVIINNNLFFPGSLWYGVFRILEVNYILVLNRYNHLQFSPSKMAFPAISPYIQILSII